MTATLRLVAGATEDPQVSRAGDRKPALAGGAKAASPGSAHSLPSAGRRLPREGSLPWARAWYDDRFKRGAQVRVAGRKARILSAGGGFVNVYVWSSGARLTVRPGDVQFP